MCKDTLARGSDPNDPLEGSPPERAKAREIAPKRVWRFTWESFPQDWRALLITSPVAGGLACVAQSTDSQESVLHGYIEFTEISSIQSGVAQINAMGGVQPRGQDKPESPELDL